MSIYSYFPEFIYEGIIQNVDYSTGICHIAPLTTRGDSEVREVPLPDLAGAGNSGLWTGSYKPGTRVIVANTSGEGKEFSVILGLLPQSNKFPDVFNSRKPENTPSGTTAYPTLREGRLIARGDNGSELILSENGEVSITAGGGGAGHYLRRYGIKSIADYKIAQEQSTFSNAGRFYAGTVRRLTPGKREIFPRSTLNNAPLFVDLNFHTVATPIGFFNGSRCYKYTYGNKKRNPELAEYRMVINEFSTDSMFTGFDDEVSRIKGEKKLFEDSETRERNREPSNTLQLAEHELIEVIGGNLIDFYGNILDLNYRKISYGDAGNKTPKKSIEKSYDAARRLSRRGIGYHFLLSTNVSSDQTSSNLNSFLFDIDKEGLLRVNIPKSSDTGNVPFPSITTFDDGTGQISVEYANKSTSEPIPVTLRDSLGNVVLPAVSSRVYRETGLRFANSDDNPYFPSNGGADGATTVRVNTTKYHNMYAIAERLIANNIVGVNIPESFTNDDGQIEGIPTGKPFEVLDEEGDTSEAIDDLNGADFQFPTYMSVAKIVPAPPAMYSGGDTVVCGIDLTDDNVAPPFSNSFVLEKGDGDEFDAQIIDPLFGKPRAKVGGKSAILNFEGSVESSIGKDHKDEKSLVIDTAGSILAWLGADAQGRSMILQTDGELLVNVGGSYFGTDQDERTMNIGKFVLRVNVSDKGHLTTEKGDSKYNVDSDFVISIGEEGLVIAGMKQGAPMVIRNDGKILIESTTDLVLKGNKVEQVDAKGKAQTNSVPGRG